MSHTEQLMTERYPDMRGATSPILDRINEAARRVSGGAGLMRIPVEATDADIVLADCSATIKNLTAELNELRKAAEEVVKEFDVLLCGGGGSPGASVRNLRAALDNLKP